MKSSYWLLSVVGSAYAQDIYKFTRMAISTEVSMTKYEVPRGNVIYLKIRLGGAIVTYLEIQGAVD